MHLNCVIFRKRAWDISFGPFKSIPMNAFMLWMSGGSLQIFSVAITAMQLFSSVKIILLFFNSSSSLFEEIKRPSSSLSKTDYQQNDISLIGPKIIFFIGNCILLFMALYKCNSMGLFETDAEGADEKHKKLDFYLQQLQQQ